MYGDVCHSDSWSCGVDLTIIHECTPLGLWLAFRPICHVGELNPNHGWLHGTRPPFSLEDGCDSTHHLRPLVANGHDWIRTSVSVSRYGATALDTLSPSYTSGLKFHSYFLGTCLVLSWLHVRPRSCIPLRCRGTPRVPPLPFCTFPLRYRILSR